MINLAEATIERIRAAWRELLGIGDLTSTTRLVYVDPDSRLGPPGWVGILGLGEAIVVTVPTIECEEAAVLAIAGLSAAQATDPQVIGPRLGDVTAVIGPSTLAYADGGTLRTTSRATVELGTSDDPRVKALVASVPHEDADEAGVSKCPPPLFFQVTSGRVVSACGYRIWADRLAHLGVLTASDARDRGHARVVGAAAASHALETGLVPQWRARRPASRAVAAALGFVPYGRQLRLRLSREPR